MTEILKNENLIKKASYLKLLAQDLAYNLKNGNFRSLFKGQGIEFEGVREYIRGDDIRTIDWNVTARMGHPFVKVFEEERELQVFLIVDNSLSMMEKNAKKSKYETESEAVALLTLACEMNSCPIGAVFFDGEINFSLKPALSKNQTLLILKKLEEERENQTAGSALDNALNGAFKLLKKKSLVFVFSDFKTDGWTKSMTRLAQKNDVIAVRLCDDFDRQLPVVGTATFEDIESNVKMVLPSSSEKLKKEWLNYNQQKEKKWKDFCLQHCVYPVLMNTKDEPLQVLNAALKNKGK